MTAVVVALLVRFNFWKPVFHKVV